MILRKNVDLYKIDDVFLLLGPGLFLFFSSAIIGGFTEGGFVPVTVALFLSAGTVSLTLIGLYYRILEKRAGKLLYLLELVSDLDIDELIRATRLKRDKIQKILGLIRQHGYGYYIWDEQLNRVYDRRLSEKYIYVESCPSCGSKMGENFSLILQKIPECAYCKNPLPLQYWNDLKLKTLETISKNNLEQFKLQKLASVSDKKPLNKGLLIFLFLFFWPAGVYYLMSRKDL